MISTRPLVAAWLNDNSVGRINEIALRWAQLVLGWVTAGVQLSVTEVYIL